MSVKRSSRIYDFNHTYQFIQMRGPNLKGFAEMAVGKAGTHETNGRSVHLLSTNPKHSPQLKHPVTDTTSTGAPYNPLTSSRTSSKSKTPDLVASNGKGGVDDGNDILAGIPQVDTEQISTGTKTNSLLRTGSHDQTTRGRDSSSSSTNLEDSLPGSVTDSQEAKGRGSPGLVRASGVTSTWREGSEGGSGGTHGATASRDLPNGGVARKKGTLKGRLKFPRLSSKK